MFKKNVDEFDLYIEKYKPSIKKTELTFKEYFLDLNNINKLTREIYDNTYEPSNRNIYNTIKDKTKEYMIKWVNLNDMDWSDNMNIYLTFDNKLNYYNHTFIGKYRIYITDIDSHKIEINDYPMSNELNLKNTRTINIPYQTIHENALYSRNVDMSYAEGLNLREITVKNKKTFDLKRI